MALPRADKRRTDPRPLPSFLRSRPKTAHLGVVLLAALMLGAGALAPAIPGLVRNPGTSGPPSGLTTLSPGHVAPAPTSIRGSGAIRPSADVLAVQETISTENGTVRPGNQVYAGGYFPDNVTADGNWVFAAMEYSNEVLVLNATTGGIESTEYYATAVPTGTAYDSLSGVVYVADELNSQLEEFDPTTGAVLGTISLPAGPAMGIQFDATDGLLVVTESTSGTVTFVSPATATAVGQVHVGGNPIGLTVDGTDGLVYVADTSSSQLSVLNLATYSLVATLTLPGNATAVQYDPANGNVYVSVLDDPDVLVYHAATHTLATSLAIGDADLPAATYVPGPEIVVFVDYDGSLYTIFGANNTWTGPIASDSGFIQTSVAYSTASNLLFEPENYAGNISAFNVTTGQLALATPLGVEPEVAAVDPFNNVVFVANYDSATLVAFSLVQNLVLATITLPGTCPDGIVYDPSDGLVYVAQWCSNSVAVVNPLTDTIVGSVGVGQYPIDLVYDAADNRMFVVNYESSNVTVLSGSTGGVVGSVALAPNSYPYAETLDTATDQLYVSALTYSAGATGTNLTAVDAATEVAGAAHHLPYYVYSVTFDPATSLIYLGTEVNFSGVWSGTLQAFDPANDSIVATIPGAYAIGAGVWDPAANAVLIPNYATNSVEALVGSPALVVGSVAVGYGPYTVVVDPNNDLLFVVNEWSDSLSEVSLVAAPDTVALASSPSFCGPVSLNGTTAPSVVLSSGTYLLTAPACYGYSFQGWATTGSIALAGETLSTQVTVTGNGTLDAEYALLPTARFSVGIDVSPVGCGSAVSVDGSSYGNAASAALAPGNYTVSAAFCNGYAFSGWQVSGNVALERLSGPMSAVLSVTTNGTLTAEYVAAPSTSPGSGSSSSGYSATEVYAFVAAGVLGGALVGVLVGRRRAPPPSPPPPEAPKAAT